jgi:alpha-D-ribose 1-methylphosphonate 5-triphosphate synthase subunit PhnH
MATQAHGGSLRMQARFRVLLQALARPGLLLALGKAAPAPVLGAAYAFAVAECLVDHEVGFATVGDGLISTERSLFDEEVRLRTGARAVPHAEAEFVFVFGIGGDAMRQLCVGDLLDPERGATLIWNVDGFAGGLRLALAGPGIEGAAALALAGVAPADIVALQELNRDYPCGVDVFFVDGGGMVVGVPRSSRITLQETA